MREDTDKTWMEIHGGYARDKTLRDEFAGLAMQKMLGPGDYQTIAECAYAMADAMLKEREEK